MPLLGAFAEPLRAPAMSGSIARMHARTLAFLALLVGCGSTPDPEDAGSDAGIDTGSEVIDTGVDAPTDPLPACGAASPLALTQCVEAERYQTDLVEVAMERDPGSSHWQMIQDLCADRLTSLGFTVERHAYATGVNVIGVREGTTDPEHQVMIAAHYDHIPGCAGADDNASGVAGVLEAARVLSMASYPRTLVIACWDEEERGLIGSRAYAARAQAAGDLIDAHFDFEMIGYVSSEPDTQRFPAGFDVLFPDAAAEVEANDNRADFVAVIGDPGAEANVDSMESFADRIGLPFVPIVVPASLIDSPLIGDLRRSDHAAFWEIDVPAMLITDSSEFRYDAYHCRTGEDVVANLNRTFSSQVIAVTVGAAAEALGL